MKPYLVPRSHKYVFKKEAERLFQIRLLKTLIDQSEEPPLLSNPKNGTVIFLSNFRKLNQIIYKKPFPTPKIQDTLLNLEVLTDESSLELNQAYYNI